MLSIKQAAPGFYYQKPNDLLADPRFGNGVWFGQCPDYGIKEGQIVTLPILELLLSRPQTLMTPSRNKSFGWDLMFSAPKSVSMVWALGLPTTRRVIESSHNMAVGRAIELLLEKCIFERCGKGGKTLRPAKGVIAVFTHVHTRPAMHAHDEIFPDPSLHSHAVLPDTIWNAEGQKKIIYTSVLIRWSKALGVWYRVWLSYLLRLNGFAIANQKNGLFTLEEFPSAWMTPFSARSQGAWCEARQQRGPDAVARASDFQATKTHDLVIEGGELQRLWKAHAERCGIDVSKFEYRSHLITEASDAEVATLSTKVLNYLAETKSVFQLADFYESVATCLIAEKHLIRPASKLIEDVIQSDKVTALAPSQCYNLPQWTSSSLLGCEQNVVELAKKLTGYKFPRADIADLPVSQTLTEEQYQAALAAASERRLVIIEGAAGTGKTASLAPVIKAYQRLLGCDSVIGTAVSWQIANALRSQFGIRTHAFADLKAVMRAKTLHFTSKNLLIVDEGGLFSSKDMEDLLKLANQTGLKLVILGDTEQLEPIGAGSGLRLIKTVVPSLSLSSIIRQETNSQKEAAQGLIDADFDGFVRALSEENRFITRPTARQCIDFIIDQIKPYYLGLEGRSTPPVILVRSNWEIHDITKRLRQLMKEAGLLQAEISVPAATPMGQNVTLHLAIGDHIRFLIRQDDNGVCNGSRAIITDISKSEDNAKILIKANVQDPSHETGTREIQFDLDQFKKPRDPRIWISPAYASTIYGTQGATYKDCIILMTRNMTFRELYVAVTRASTACQIIEVAPPLIDIPTSEDIRVRLDRRRVINVKKLHVQKKAKPLAIEHLIGNIQIQSLPEIAPTL